MLKELQRRWPKWPLAQGLARLVLFLVPLLTAPPPPSLEALPLTLLEAPQEAPLLARAPLSLEVLPLLGAAAAPLGQPPPPPREHTPREHTPRAQTPRAQTPRAQTPLEATLLLPKVSSSQGLPLWPLGKVPRPLGKAPRPLGKAPRQRGPLPLKEASRPPEAQTPRAPQPTPPLTLALALPELVPTLAR